MGIVLRAGIVFFALSFGGAHSLAQSPITFQIAFGGSDYDVSHMMMQLTNNGTYIVTGETYSFGAGQDDIYMADIDALGNVIWSKTYGTGSSERSHCVRQTSDGGYIISGYVSSNGRDACLIKTDATGNIQWARAYGGSLPEEGFSVRQTTDGGYIMAGVTANYTGTVNLEMYVVKTDATGNVSWTHSYGVNGFLGDEARDVVETPNGYVILAQTSTPGLRDVAIVKLNKSNGSVMWAKRYNFYSYDEPKTISRTNDGGYIVCGYASTGANEDAFLLKTDSGGSVQWSKTYGDVYSNRGWGVVQTIDGGYAFTGSWSRSTLTGEDMYVLKTDASGNGQFLRTMGTTDDDLGYILQQTPDSGFAVSGILCCGNQGPGDRDFLLSKTDKQGDIFGVCNLLTPNYTVGSPLVSGFQLNLNVNTFGTVSTPSLITTSPATQTVFLCNSVILPVELVYFNGQPEGESVYLSWVTASEINNDFFTVEKSVDAKSFESIAVIDGMASSTIETKYFHYDEDPVPGINYYRLRQTDFDGTVNYSEIIAVKMKPGRVAVYPNPVEKSATVYYTTGEERVVLTLSDTRGKELISMSLPSSESKVEINFEGLNSGVYILRVADSSSVYSERVVRR